MLRRVFRVKNKEAPAGCLLVFMCLLSTAGHGQSLEELEILQFGTLAVPGNGSVSELELSRSGQISNLSGALIVVAPGVPGRYLLSGLAADLPVDVAANDAELFFAGAGGSERLQVGGYDAADNLVTNFQGEIEFQLGAVLRTTGNNNPYDDGPYQGSTRIELTYWDSDLGGFVTRGFDIEIQSELRTSLNLNETATMNFGTIFARGTPDDQAALNLLPNGKFSILNSGNARIVSLSSPQHAVLTISGAAPNRAISIDLPGSDLFLQNIEEPTAPRFILNQFVSSPSGTGRTDENGVLEISVGGTLSTQIVTEEVVYPAGTYETTYDITVSY